MPVATLYSAPGENYLEHITRCREKFELLFPLFHYTIARTFEPSTEMKILKDIFLKMIIFHDLGKLTKRWQDDLRANKRPPHSTLGAAYLWKILPDGFKEPISFAVAIHHTDKGLLGDNIERPDVRAILDGIVDNNGNIIWHDETKNLAEDFFPKEAGRLNVLDLKVSDLKEMARGSKGLRVWAKGGSLIKQHQKRMQASLAHHILKLCDISAAAERKEYKKKDDQDYYDGGLMVENIKNYVESISLRQRSAEMLVELQRWTELLKTQYQPDKIILFGSFARHEIRRWSDIDLIIIKRTDKKFLDRIKDVLLLLRPKVGIDILVYTPDEFRNLCSQRLFFKNEIEAKGVTIYER